IFDKAAARARRKRSKIDAALLRPVVARDEPGNHPRVNGMAIRTQQREASAFGGRVAEALQHGEMAVPAADEKKMFHRVMERACWVIVTAVASTAEGENALPRSSGKRGASVIHF